MDDWVDVCEVNDIPRLGARVLRRPSGIPIALFRTASDRVFALEDRCPHRGGPLSQGIVAGERVVCPLHGWTIAFDSGAAVAPDEGCTRSYAVEVCEGRVRLHAGDLVETANTASAPLCSD